MDSPLTIALIAVSVIGFIVLVTIYQKRKIMNFIRNGYGKKYKDKNDERSFESISQYYRCYQPSADVDLDNQTWIDLQMDEMFNQFDYTQSSIGSEYVYRHLRIQKHNTLDMMEDHIKYFSIHKEEREKLQYAFYHIKNKEDNQFINHIKDPNIFRKISMFPLAVFTLVALLPFLLYFLSAIHMFSVDDGYIFVFAIFVWISAIYYSSVCTKKIGKAWNAIQTFMALSTAIKTIRKLDRDVFGKQLQQMQKAMKDFSFQYEILSALASLTIRPNSIIAVVTMYFSIYGYVYNMIVNLFKDKKEKILKIYETIGYLELCIAMASYRKTVDFYCKPVFHRKETIDFENLYHPLLKDPVVNSKSLNKFNIITGANASGKTTFAKTIALSTITAQTLNISYASSFTIKPAHIITSINIEDDLLQGDSFYLAEIKRMKQILDLSNSRDVYLMIILDELLKGTNVKERIASASAILYAFSKADCFLCLTTHDVELSTIMAPLYDNYHFREETKENTMFYDYKLYDGVTTGSNAISLLQLCNYNPEIVENAKLFVRHFDSTQEWMNYSDLIPRKNYIDGRISGNNIMHK